MIPEDLRADLFRYKGNVDFKSFLMCYLFNAAFRWQVAFRLVNSHGAYKLIGLFLWCINMNRKRIQIPRETKIGGGYILVMMVLSSLIHRQKLGAIVIYHSL